MIEQTLILLKPDAVQRGLTGEILHRLERAGLKIVGMKMVWAERDFAKKHYIDHIGKPFYKGLEDVIVSGPVVAMVLEGVEAIALVRKLCGPTDPKSAPPGTIRGDFAQVSYEHADEKKIGIKNVIHASANKKDAEREIKLWFKKKELHSYQTVHEVHVF